MFDLNFSDREIATLCDNALSAVNSISRSSALFETETLQLILRDALAIRELSKEVDSRIESDRQLSSVFLANVAAGLNLDLVASLFAGKLSEDRIKQLRQQALQGDFVSKQVGLRHSHLDQKNGKREGSERRKLDWSAITSYLESAGVKSGLTDYAKKAYQERSSVRKYFERIWSGDTLDVHQLNVVKEVLGKYTS
jgi:hypothetical protein